MRLYLLSVTLDLRSDLLVVCFVRLLFQWDKTKECLWHTVLRKGEIVSRFTLYTTAPSASASFSAYRRTSPRSPTTVSRTTPRLSSLTSLPTAGEAAAGAGVGTSSQRPKAQLRIHHGRDSSAAAGMEEGEVNRIKPFTRYTLSLESWLRAAVRVGSSSRGGGRVVLGSSRRLGV